MDGNGFNALFEDGSYKYLTTNLSATTTFSETEMVKSPRAETRTMRCWRPPESVAK